MRVEPLTANESRIHMTVSSQFLEKLEAARRGRGTCSRARRRSR